MSDNIKIVIEISKEDYEFIKRCGNPKMEGYASIQNGKPLSDVLNEIKGEIEDLAEQYKEYRYANTYISLCMKVIDKHIGKAESEKE